MEEYVFLVVLLSETTKQELLYLVDSVFRMVLLILPNCFGILNRYQRKILHRFHAISAITPIAELWFLCHCLTFFQRFMAEEIFS